MAVEEPLDAARVAGGLIGVEEAPDDGEGAGGPQGIGVVRGGWCGARPGRRAGDDGAAPDVFEDGQSDRDHVLAEAAVGEARAGAHAG